MNAQPHIIASAQNRSIGAILIDSGRLGPEDAERILRLQKEQNLRFGDAALSLGLLDQSDIQFALSHQFDYPYLRGGDAHVAEELVAAYQPFSPQVEELRALRSQLMLRWLGTETGSKTLAVVSAGRGEGRSWLAANLAVVFSQLGERTLLVDADLRNPRQHALFKLDNKTGLSTLLSGRESELTLVRIESLKDLSVLPAGPTPPNPQELLGRKSFGDMLAQCRQYYDVIVIDTPAGHGVADAQKIAALAGGCLLLARKDTTQVAELVPFKDQLLGAGADVVGTVLNEF
jgi:receptor protein-tyrosine kinase